ncbi:MAG: sialate O-acetylesterase [Clostridia bacterium]|nr:sialate O-acetylesterase [Clostridia bacterium]
MKSFLMIGQSNMAGRGDFGEVPEIVNPNCFMLRNGRFIPMSEPINPDRKIWGDFHSGVGLAASFADEYAKYFNEKVGLIPCADGGTSISEWQPDEILFDNAVNQARLAQRSSEIVGILWHQGENDSIDLSDVKKYAERFKNTIDTLKKELDLSDDIPIIIGALGDFVGEYQDGRCRYFEEINTILEKLAADYGAFVSAEGLKCKDDGIHFNSVSYREFGKRYFNAYLQIVKK